MSGKNRNSERGFSEKTSNLPCLLRNIQFLIYSFLVNLKQSVHVRKENVWNRQGANYVFTPILLCLDTELNYFTRGKKLKQNLKTYLILVNLDALNIGYPL